MGCARREQLQALARRALPQQEGGDVATYLGGDQIDNAQAVLERHTVSSADGRCRSCGVPGPCVDHERAARVFALALRLPRRVPGLTEPHRIGGSRSAGPGWFEAAS